MRCFFIYLTLFLQLILKTSVFSITQLTHKTITNMKTLITALCLMLSFGYAYTQVILYTPCETNIVPIAEDSSDVFTEKEGLWLNKTLDPLYEQQVLKGGFLQIVRGQPTNYKYDFISKRVALFYGSLGNITDKGFFFNQCSEKSHLKNVPSISLDSLSVSEMHEKAIIDTIKSIMPIELHVFNAAEKEETGYDAAIVFWSKRYFTTKKVVKQIKKLNNKR